MNTNRYAIFMILTAAMYCAGCANSAELQRQEEAKAADIAEILSVELDPAEYGERKRCLSETEYLSFRPLDDKHLLFVGRGDKLWINTLRSKCMDLHHGDVLIIRPFSPSRLCDADRFEATDWFSWPWYTRTPWHSPHHWGSGPTCVLGTFQPVTKAQVDEIEAIIKSDNY